MTHSEALSRLADAYGITRSYTDWRGEEVQVAPDTIRAILAGLDVSVGDDAGAAAALDALGRARHARVLAPTQTARQGRPDTFRLPIRVPVGVTPRVSVEQADGASRELAAAPSHTEELEGVARAIATVQLPADLPTGWHRLTVETGDEAHHAALAVAPERTPLPLGDRRVWGWMLQLYALRSADSWGLGDLGDLRRLATWSARAHGAQFVLCNPLHAITPVPPVQPSPYYPSSRRFVNPGYLRIADIPELAALDADARDRLAGLERAQQAANRSERLERDAVFRAKLEALALLHAAPRPPERQAAYERFRERAGAGLERLAVFCALAESHGVDFRAWPEPLRHPAGAAVAAAAAERSDRVAFHTWLQWLCDEQLAAVQAAATGAGMGLGVIHDLAVGVDPAGADAWALQDDLASAVTVGAPPDPFNQQGQDWALPPLRPDRLAATGFAPFRQMLQSVLRHAGGIRVDHVLGLFRLWWIPAGAGPQEGTYVAYPAQAMLDVLALEADRAGAMVIGEDLGTVAPGVREDMADRDMLGSRILYFERVPWSEEPLPAADYPRLALSSVTTHDLPTAAGWWADQDVRIQAELGLLGAGSSRSAELERKGREKAALVELLRREGLVGDDPTPRQLIVAMHAFLSRTPSLLVAAQLNDAVGDPDQPNMPGTVDEYPNWRLPLAEPTDGGRQPLLLDDLVAHPMVGDLVRALRSGR